jgi:hypothetical protein
LLVCWNSVCVVTEASVRGGATKPTKPVQVRVGAHKRNAAAYRRPVAIADNVIHSSDAVREGKRLS